ncbi:MAG: hypothetical protein GXO09_02250 [Crenarchaeota archaeon]|nr:hypothetical protein [Thermoproteota archaeon]
MAFEQQFAREITALREQGELGETIAELFTVLMKRLQSMEERLEARLEEVSARLDRIEDRLDGLEEEVSGLKSRLGRVEVTVGGVAEAMLSRLALDVLRGEGYEVVAAERNYRVDDEDVDLLVRARRDGEERVFLVEVKVKPRHSDVGALLAKKELVEARLGASVTPVLAAVYLGREVEAYAKGKNVLVLKL